MNELVIRRAAHEELAEAAALRWSWVIEENAGSSTLSREQFVAAFVEWADAHSESHRCYVAVSDARVIGMAWLAIVPRVPSPRDLSRVSADLQSVFVHPEHRNAGVGGRLIAVVLEDATALGAERVTVHSSVEAIPAYQRAGFAHNPRLLDLAPGQLRR